MIRRSCMVAEDQALIAMSIEAYLEESGFEVAGPFPTSAKALKWLERATPGLAILDVMLQDGPSLRLARELKARAIPFVIYSGLPPTPTIPPEFQDVPWLEKPVSRENLARTLEQMAAAAGETYSPKNIASASAEYLGSFEAKPLVYAQRR